MLSIFSIEGILIAIGGLLAFAGLFLFCLFYSAIGDYVFGYWTFRSIDNLPGPPKKWLIGNLHQIVTNDPKMKISMHWKIIKEHGKLGFYRIWAGPVPLVYIVGPAASRLVISTTKHSVKGKMYESLEPWLKAGLLLSNGDKWKSRRRLLTPAFHYEVLTRYLEVMDEQSKVLITKLDGIANGQPINIYEKITLCALDIICETAMGKNIDAQHMNPNAKYYIDAVYQVGELAVRRLDNPLYWSSIYWLTFEGREFAKNLKILHKFSLDVIQSRRRNIQADKVGKNRRPAFLDLLLTTEVDGKPMSDADIQEEVDTFMFEGHDTTANGISWCLYLLGSNPEAQQRVYEEAMEILGDTPPTVESLGKLKYLEKVLKESLRLYPPVPTIGRITTEDLDMSHINSTNDNPKDFLNTNFNSTGNQMVIPKGTMVLLSFFHLHRNPAVWADPEKFLPSRWDNLSSEMNESGENESLDPYAYSPFSAGPRNCIGRAFAMLEEKLIVARVIMNFELSSLPNRQPIMNPSLVLRPFDGIYLNVKPRAK